ncbi:FtsB family cell division protein [Rubrivirga litoralis]|uniref:Septum formation initiator family protein n=1 Tax=Rubrivirga litoralis TaxID=3075598 RepID=A0ABU3BQR0_9BACT|nr:septum formation initiator family protein [Rubrivirga sp. F394]MDT0631624.1 septum formation initiator family protein [Rubrivirga sp. F394]
MPQRLRRRLALVGVVGLILWVAFFDSHSVWRRVAYAQELDRMSEENAAIGAENDALEARLDRGLDDATVERVAREQYGMRRPGERVYRVEDAPE